MANKRITKDSKITLYADSGRISNKRLSDIIQSHIDNKYITAAFRSINEYEENIKSQYSIQMDKISDWRKQAEDIQAAENEIKRYKKDLLK